MCAARERGFKLGDKIDAKALENLRSKLPGYVPPEERERVAAENARQQVIAEQKKVKEFIEQNSKRLAFDFLQSLVSFLEAKITKQIYARGEDGDDEESVRAYDPHQHYNSAELGTITQHLERFRHDKAELAANNHLADREQELRYANVGFRKNVPGAFDNFLNEIGMPEDRVIKRSKLSSARGRSKK